jgi:DnaJ family protein C protein 9
LSDDNKRKLYDEQKIVDDEDEQFGSSWLEAFMNVFKPLTETEIEDYRLKYIGSDLEKDDLKKAYVTGKGCINYIMEHVPFMEIEDEPRFHAIVDEWIKNDEVPEFKAFTDEPKAKRNRRHKKYAKEAREARHILATRKENEAKEAESLTQMIAKRQAQRSNEYGSFIDNLAAKYSAMEEEEDDDSEDFDIKEASSKMKGKNRKRPATTRKATKKETPIKSGRVTKKKK